MQSLKTTASISSGLLTKHTHTNMIKPISNLMAITTARGTLGEGRDIMPTIDLETDY